MLSLDLSVQAGPIEVGVTVNDNFNLRPHVGVGYPTTPEPA